MDKLKAMKMSGKITAFTLRHLKELILNGETDGDNLDKVAETIIRKYGGKPAFKDYQGFSANICLSINNEIVHGLPYGKKIKRNDVVKIDVGTIFEGYYTDSALTIMKGFDRIKRRLIERTELALEDTIEYLDMIHPDCQLSAIPDTIIRTVNGMYGIIKDFGGHGIGKKLHQDMFVPNTYKNLKDRKLIIGQALCIEPMLTLGTNEVVKTKNGTILTADGKCAAHFEHTIYIGENKIEVLTRG